MGWCCFCVLTKAPIRGWSLSDSPLADWRQIFRPTLTQNWDWTQVTLNRVADFGSQHAGQRNRKYKDLTRISGIGRTLAFAIPDIGVHNSFSSFTCVAAIFWAVTRPRVSYLGCYVTLPRSCYYQYFDFCIGVTVLCCGYLLRSL